MYLTNFMMVPFNMTEKLPHTPDGGLEMCVSMFG